MWWKKLLYFLLVGFLGFGVVVISGSINFNIQAKNLMSDALRLNDYSTIEQFFCYVTGKNQYLVRKDYEDGTHIEAYRALVKHPHYVYYPDEGHVVTYDVVEEAICFSFFHLPNTFKQEDVGEGKGRVALNLNSGEKLDIFFDNRDKEEGDVNYYINFYSFASQYFSLTSYITFDDYLSLSTAENPAILGFHVYDGRGENFYDYEFPNPVSFDSKMHEDYKDSCKEYRDFMHEYGQSISEGAYTERNRLLANIDAVTNTHPDLYYPKPSTNIIFATDSFVLTISLVAAIYISVAFVVTRLLFKKIWR